MKLRVRYVRPLLTCSRSRTWFCLSIKLLSPSLLRWTNFVFLLFVRFHTPTLSSIWSTIVSSIWSPIVSFLPCLRPSPSSPSFILFGSSFGSLLGIHSKPSTARHSCSRHLPRAKPGFNIVSLHRLSVTSGRAGSTTTSQPSPVTYLSGPLALSSKYSTVTFSVGIDFSSFSSITSPPPHHDYLRVAIAYFNGPQ